MGKGARIVNGSSVATAALIEHFKGVEGERDLWFHMREIILRGA
jgi:hypothetical protein